MLHGNDCYIGVNVTFCDSVIAHVVVKLSSSM